MAVDTAEPDSESSPHAASRSPVTRSPSGQNIYRDDPVPNEARFTAVTPVVHALPGDLQWQVGDFVETTGGVRHAFVLSPAGQVLAASGALDREQVDQFATMVFTLGVLAQSLDTVCGIGRPRRTLMHLRNGVLCHMALPSGFFLAVVAESDGKSQQVGYEAAACLAARVRPVLRPEVRA